MPLDAEIGNIHAIVFTSSQWVIKPKEIITSLAFHEISVSFCTACSYRNATDLLNAAFHRDNSNSIKLKTLSDRILSEGNRIQKSIDNKTEQILTEHNFDPSTGLPQDIREELMKVHTEDSKASELFKGIIETYNIGREDCDKIKDIDIINQTEINPSKCVYISIDDVGVSHQKNTRKNGGAKNGKVVENTIIHIESNECEYRIAAIGMDNAFARLVAFLVSNNLLTDKNLIFFSDGASNIRCALEKYFSFRNYTLILDWYHLDKRMYELMSMAISGNKESKAEFEYELKRKLWVGNVQDAIAFLEAVPTTKIRNKKCLEDAIAYLERKKPYITCYALRKLLKYRNSSNPGEKSNDILCAKRQKHNGMSWSNGGSGSLTIITAMMKNQEYKEYLKTGDIAFRLVPKCA